MSADRETYTNKGEHFNYNRCEFQDSYWDEVLSYFVDLLINECNDPLVVDLGSGTGEEANYLDTCFQKETVRVDIADVAGDSQIGRKFVQAEVLDLPFGDKAFDAVHCKDVMTHIPLEYRYRFFDELKRVMARGGLALLVFAPTRSDELYLHQHDTSLDRILRNVEESDFQIEVVGGWRSGGKRDWYGKTGRNLERVVMVLRAY